MLLAERGVALDEIGAELSRRARPSANGGDAVVRARTRLAGLAGDRSGDGGEIRRTGGAHAGASCSRYVPRAYLDWRQPIAIAALREGEAVVVGSVVHVKERKGRFPLVTAVLADDTGRVEAKFFGRTYLFGKLAAGDRLFVAGRVTRAGLLPEINVTNHRTLREDEPFEGEIVPVYPASKDLPSRTIRAAIGKNLERLIAQHGDALPPALVRRFGFPPLDQAWREVHAPRDPEASRPLRASASSSTSSSPSRWARRLKRARREAEGGARADRAPTGWWDAWRAQLPFAPTGAQRRVIERIWADMARTAPMNRLLQGDVAAARRSSPRRRSCSRTATACSRR